MLCWKVTVVTFSFRKEVLNIAMILDILGLMLVFWLNLKDIRCQNRISSEVPEVQNIQNVFFLPLGVFGLQLVPLAWHGCILVPRQK